MSVNSESAEQMTKMILDGSEFTLKIAGNISKELVALIIAYAQSNQKTKGKTNLSNMLKSGKELKVFSIDKENTATFIREAKRYGVLYSAIIDKDKTNPVIDVLVKAEDASKINRIFEKYELQTCDVGKIKSEVMEDNKAPLVEKKKEVQSKNSLMQFKKPEVNSKESIIGQLNSISNEINTKDKSIEKTLKIFKKKGGIGYDK